MQPAGMPLSCQRAYSVLSAGTIWNSALLRNVAAKLVESACDPSIPCVPGREAANRRPYTGRSGAATWNTAVASRSLSPSFQPLR
jgi:hypothetical protein